MLFSFLWVMYFSLLTLTEANISSSFWDKRWVLGLWPDKEGFLTRQIKYKIMLISENNMMKKLAPGLGDPSDGLHDPLHERINWKLCWSRVTCPCLLLTTFCWSRWLDISQVLFMCCYGPPCSPIQTHDSLYPAHSQIQQYYIIMLQVKIRLRLKSFNLGWFSFFLCLLALIHE